MKALNTQDKVSLVKLRSIKLSGVVLCIFVFGVLKFFVWMPLVSFCRWLKREQSVADEYNWYL